VERKRTSVLIGLGSVAAFLLLWHLAAVWGVLSPESSIPSLSAVTKAARNWLSEGFLSRDLAASLMRVIPGIVIGSACGGLLGLATGRIGILYQIVGPHLHMWRALPAVAVVPLLLLILGVNESTRIIVVSLGVFFPVWVSAHEGSAQVDPRFLEVARDLDFSPSQLYVRVIFPATVPFIIAGIRTGIGLAYIMVFIAEWIGANKGIGYRLSVAHSVLRTDHMVFGLVVLGVLAYCTDAVYRLAARRLFPWTEKKHG